MKIRIVERGFENFTGHFGVIEFNAGLSVGDVPNHEIDRLAANIQITDADGNPIGVAHRIVQTHSDVAPVIARLQTAEELNLPDEKPAKQEAPVEQQAMPRFYTEAELSEIGDKGIKTLRFVGDEWGVKGKAIAELIGDILAAQDEYRRKRGLEPLARTVAEEGGQADADVVVTDAAEA